MVWAGVIKLARGVITGGYRKLFIQKNEKMLSISTSPGRNFACSRGHVDLFEQSSSPPEMNIKWPKTEHKTAKNGWKLTEQSRYYREYPAAFGQKREIVGVGQSDTANNTLCRYFFQVHPFLAKKAPGTPVFGHCPLINLALEFDGENRSKGKIGRNLTLY